MNRFFRSLLYIFTITAVLLSSAVGTTIVYADGGTEGDPPPADTPATEPADPPLEDPAEAPSVEDPVEEISEADSQEPTEEPQAEIPPVEPEAEPPAEEPASVPEILEQVPEGTDLVVVNEEGEPEPLASEAAAEILVEGDPIWCPTGAAPGDPSCSNSHTSFDALITDLAGGTYSGDGVIYVESSYSLFLDTAPIIFDSSNANLTNLEDISVLGGWDGVSGSTNIDSSNPSLLDDPLAFLNWSGTVSISNLEIVNSNDVSGSLVIETDQDITLSNVAIYSNGAGSGAVLDNCLDAGSGCTSIGNVTVTDSVFTNNAGVGLDIDSGGVTEIGFIAADGNGSEGVNVNAHLEAGSEVIIKDTTTTFNSQAGIEVSDVAGDLTIKTSYTHDNTGQGIQTNDVFGDLTIKDVFASYNNQEGIEIDTTRGDVRLINVTADYSTSNDGVEIHNSDGNVTLIDVTATNNNLNGIEIFNVDGSLGLSCVQTSENDGDGIFIQIDHNFYIKCSQSTDNVGDGLQIVDAPTAQLLSFTATGNSGQDINYAPLVTTVTEKTVDCSGKKKSEPSGEKGPWTKLHCLPGEIKVALYDTYGDKVEFENLCGYEAGVFDPNSWNLPEEIPGGGDEYILSLQEKMLEEIPGLEAITKYGLPGIIAQILDELPFMLPDGFSYASAFFTAVVDESEELVDPLPDESGLTIRFRVPEWLDPGDVLTILWWDGVDWVDLGGEYSEDGYYFEVTTEETGVFVLATFEIES